MKRVMILVVSLGLVACANPSSAGEAVEERIKRIETVTISENFNSSIFQDSDTGCKYLMIQSFLNDESGISIMHKENGEPDCGLSKD